MAFGKTLPDWNKSNLPGSKVRNVNVKVGAQLHNPAAQTLVCMGGGGAGARLMDLVWNAKPRSSVQRAPA